MVGDVPLFMTRAANELLAIQPKTKNDQSGQIRAVDLLAFAFIGGCGWRRAAVHDARSDAAAAGHWGSLPVGLRAGAAERAAAAMM